MRNGKTARLRTSALRKVTGRAGLNATLGVTVLAVAALVLTACSSGGGGGGGTSHSGGTTTTVDKPAVTIAVTPSSDSSVNPTTPIVVKATGGRLTSVAVTNAAKGTTVTGALAADKGTWTSNEVLGYGSTYNVVAHGKDAKGLTTQKQATIKTIDPKQQANANMIPAPGTVQNSGIGVGQPIVFQFTYPVKNKAEVQKHLQVTSNPPQEGAWYWIDSKNVHYRPKEFWKPGTTIHVKANVYGLDFGGGVYGADDRDVTYKVHDSWIGKADGNTEHMTIYHNGQAVKTMPISMGKDATPTHEGIHVVSAKHADYIMDSCTYGVCKGDPNYYRSHEKWSVRISNDGEFVHENPNSVGDQGSSNVSHGCINLNAANGQWFFQHFSYGDVVEVSNSGGKQLPVWDLYGDWSVPWSTWQAGNAND
ncbi:MAG: L,D-transpeptidase [Sciscionella sp.]